MVLLRTGRGNDIDSLAVLPFENASADPDAEYLSDGIAESVIGSATRIPRLKVIAFSSVLRYKGHALDLEQVVRELGVRAVVTGRVVQRGEALSISVELVDTKDRSRLWGEQYSQRLTDVLAIQEDISRKISEELRGHLTGEATKGLTRQATQNAEAYQALSEGPLLLEQVLARGLPEEPGALPGGDRQGPALRPGPCRPRRLLRLPGRRRSLPSRRDDEGGGGGRAQGP